MEHPHYVGKQTRKLSCYKYGKHVEPRIHGQDGCESCIISTEVCCGTGQFSFLSSFESGKYIEIPLVSATTKGIFLSGGGHGSSSQSP